MSTRIIDLTKEEFIEVKSSFLVKHLSNVVDALKAERQTRLNSAKELATSTEEAITFIAGYVADLQLTGKAKQFADHLDQVAALSKRINKLQTHSNSLTLLESAATVRLNMDQAKEFSL